MWNANDSVALRTYLGGSPNFLKELKARAPRAEGKTVEERAVTGSEAEGARKVIELIEDVLTHDAPRNPNATQFVSDETRIPE